MLWGMIWHGGRSDLLVMMRDPEAKRNGYSSWSYREVLEEGLLPWYEPGDVFQQDNAPIHNVGATKDWLEEHGVWVINWPAHSPDLNPIEHAWACLKRNMYRMFPNSYALRDNEVDLVEFQRMVRAAWEAIPQATLDRLMDSIPNRLRAVHRARGWYTKY